MDMSERTLDNFFLKAWTNHPNILMVLLLNGNGNIIESNYSLMQDSNNWVSGVIKNLKNIQDAFQMPESLNFSNLFLGEWHC